MRVAHPFLAPLRSLARGRLAPLLLLLALAGGSAVAADRGPTAAAPAGQLIDRVWAGHPVGFDLLIERGHQFIAYYDADRRITVAGRRLPDGAWTYVRPAGVPLPARRRDSNVIGWDSHNSLQLALDRDGCLHLSGNMHVDPLVYYRTRAPFDLTTLERLDRMTGERENRVTYPVFFKNAAGDLLFRYRDGSSGNGNDYYNRYDLATRTWRRLLDTPLLDGEGERNAYATAPILGPDGRFHLLWVWRETPDAATNHTLSYARSRDLVHWETSAGRPLALPIKLATGDIIDRTPPGGGLVNMVRDLGFDAQGRPVAVYHRYDAQGHSQAYAARPRTPTPSAPPTAAAAAEGWDIVQLTQWNFRWAFGGGGSIPADVTLGRPSAQPDGTLLVDFRARQVGAGRWRLDPATLQVREQLPAVPSPVPAAWRRPSGVAPGLEVQMITRRAAGRLWVLRWETQPRNRDRPHPTIPPPSELRLDELP